MPRSRIPCPKVPKMYLSKCSNAAYELKLDAASSSLEFGQQMRYQI